MSWRRRPAALSSQVLDAAGRRTGVGQLGHRPRPGLGGPCRRQPLRARVGQLAAASRIADIGSGAGFPGLPLAAALPSARVDLIESVNRKCRFMRRAIEQAGITNATVCCCRSEELGSGRRVARPTRRSPPAPSAGSRPWPSWPRRCLREGGVLVAWKGRRDPRRRRSWPGAGIAGDARRGRDRGRRPTPPAATATCTCCARAGRPRTGCRDGAGMAKKRPARQVRVRAAALTKLAADGWRHCANDVSLAG